MPLLVKIERVILLALLFFIPFSLHYVTMSPAAISLLNLLSVTVISLGLLNLILGLVPFTPLSDRRTIFVFILLMIAMVFALFFTSPLRNGVGLWTSRLLQPLLLAFAVFQLLAAGYLKVEEIVRAFFLSLIPLIVGGLLQFIGVIPDGVDASRITVLYHEPNTFARYIEILLLLSFPWIFFQAAKVVWWEVMTWVLGVALLLTTKSYNGVATFVIGMAVIVACLPDTYRRAKQWVFGALGVMIIIVALNVNHLPKWQTSINDSRLTRLEFWQVAIATIKDHFWTGIGIKGWESQYTNLVVHYGHVPPLNWNSPQPHNIFLDSMLKAGPLGLVAVTLLLLWPIVQGSHIIRQKLKEIDWFGYSLLGYGVAMICFGMIDDPLWSDDTVPILFILILTASWYYSRNQNLSKSL